MEDRFLQFFAVFCGLWTGLGLVFPKTSANQL